MARKFFIFVVALTMFCLGAVAEDGYQLWINGTLSKFHPIKVQDQIVVPLDFPAQVEEMEWSVSVRRDEKTRKVEVKMSPKRRTTRGENPCHVCIGSGKCQSCYPAGSGENTSGQPDYMCTGTGKCWYCKGEGKW